ncbi:hypothetical protein CR513_32948, partial [Mucuna pruriens]
MHKTKEEHAEHLKVVLQVLKDKQMYAKMFKCDFWLEEGGITLDPSKTTTILEWEIARSISDTRSFIGLVGESLVVGPEVVQKSTKKVKLIQEKMRMAQSRKKSYQDKRPKDLKFKEKDHLCKYVFDPSHVIELDDVQARDNLSYEVLLVRIEDRRIKQQRRKEIHLVKIVWKGTSSNDATWELESQMEALYPKMFTTR